MNAFAVCLERSAALRVRTSGTGYERAVLEYVESFQTARAAQPVERTLQFGATDRMLLLDAIKRALAEDEFTLRNADFGRGLFDAAWELTPDFRDGFFATFRRRSETMTLSFEVRIEVDPDNTARIATSRDLPAWNDRFGQRMRELLAHAAQGPLPAPAGPTLAAAGPADDDTYLAPGKPLREPYAGALHDYSGCARDGELEPLRHGALPLGRYAFTPPPGPRLAGPPLFVGAPAIFNGALLCAPQNSGKTELILRWARAANAAGFHTFVLDVKGTLRDKLGPALRGTIRTFSTDPYAASDSINFLADCDPRDEIGLQRIGQLIAALMPKDGWESGEQSYFYQNHVSWFEALLNILLLDAHYDRGRYPGGVPAFADLYDMARDETALYTVMDRVHAAERSGAAPPSAWAPPLNWWFGELGLLIERKHGGRRSARYEYQELTRAIVNALRPFSRYGTLYRRTGGPPQPGAGAAFSLAELGRGTEPTTIVIAAREQDVGVAETVLRIVVTRLQQLLFDRFRQVQAREKIPPILLLLDETRRIPQFDPGRYITFAREAQAGCVIAYQSLDQIGEAEKIVEILENVGTQIYLGSLVGNTARHVVEMLPRRERPTFSHTSSLGSDGASRGVQSGTESVPYFSTMDLFRLPAGRWPALVLLNGTPRTRPFLVDLDTNVQPTAEVRR